MWACTYFFFFVMICTHLKCYTPSDVHLVMCALCEKKWLKELLHQKRNKILFSSMFFLWFFYFDFFFFFFFFFLVFLFCFFFFFFICVLIIWLSFMHHIIIMQHMFHDLNPFIPLQTCFKWTWVFIFQKRGRRFKHSNFIYVLSHLTKMKQTTKAFENEIIQNKLIKTNRLG